MIREGSVVGWLCAPEGKKREFLLCYVRRWNGRPDSHVELVTEKCLLSGGPARYDATALTYVTQLVEVDWVNMHGDVIVPKARADEIGQQIVAFLQTKKGKAMVARPPRENPAPPDAGRGQPQRKDLPSRTTRGFTGNLNNAMTYYISDGGQRTWSLNHLKARSIVMHDVFVDRESFGYSFKEIGGRRSISEPYARQLYLRARIDMRSLSVFFPIAMDRERRQADAA